MPASSRRRDRVVHPVSLLTPVPESPTPGRRRRRYQTMITVMKAVRQKLRCGPAAITCGTDTSPTSAGDGNSRWRLQPGPSRWELGGEVKDVRTILPLPVGRFWGGGAYHNPFQPCALLPLPAATTRRTGQDRTSLAEPCGPPPHCPSLTKSPGLFPNPAGLIGQRDRG
jgi:hypothetical protein